VTGSGGGIAAGGGAFRGERSPVRKKTRFVTEKGIREAGRESLGELLSVGVGGKGRRQVVLDDDDDDLIIVK
jgi:minichromosome maintenance protein 10